MCLWETILLPHDYPSAAPVERSNSPHTRSRVNPRCSGVPLSFGRCYLLLAHDYPRARSCSVQQPPTTPHACSPGSPTGLLPPTCIVDCALCSMPPTCIITSSPPVSLQARRAQEEEEAPRSSTASPAPKAMPHAPHLRGARQTWRLAFTLYCYYPYCIVYSIHTRV